MTKDIYLTIDDSPSVHMKKKVDFLLKHKIPAVFFCRGEFMERHKEHVVDAIQKGFLMGNHSYTHPYFSQIPLEDCFDEILRTENLIEECYKAAKVQRPFKVFRFPFGDRGGKGKNLEDPKVQKLQDFIKKMGFVAIDFQYEIPDTFTDAVWDWDTEDYKEKYIQNPSQYKNKLEEFWCQSKKKSLVLLLHDFDHTHHLFEISMDFLQSKKARFLPFKEAKV